MKVLLVAYPLTPVSEDVAGGSEQILALLDRELVRRGHESYVLAAAGSRTHGALIASPSWDGPVKREVRAWGAETHARLLNELCRDGRFDLVNMHSLDFHRYLPDGATPVLATLHLPANWYPSAAFFPTRANTFLTCVSRKQWEACPPSEAILPPCENGVEVDRFCAAAPRRSYALSLGRICPEKGFHLAMDAARLAGADFALAGALLQKAQHQRYFRDQIAPRLDGRRKYLGPAGFGFKRQLLAEASCLLIPSMVAETSSLVAMEALASGTPVVAFPNGALPEIIDHGRTGFLVGGVDEMAEAIHACRSLSRSCCRAEAKWRFSVGAMVERYLCTYQRTINSARDSRSLIPTRRERRLIRPDDAAPRQAPAVARSRLLSWDG